MSSKTATNERVQNQKGMTTIEKKAKFWQESRQKPYKRSWANVHCTLPWAIHLILENSFPFYEKEIINDIYWEISETFGVAIFKNTREQPLPMWVSRITCIFAVVQTTIYVVASMYSFSIFIYLYGLKVLNISGICS